MSTVASLQGCASKSSSSFEPGTRKKLENYSYPLHDIIGKGYSSQVYRGRDDDTSEPVAIKVIDMKMLRNDLNRMLLSSEIENLKKLQDTPHILQLYEVFTTKNNTYLITELCDGDLSAKIKSKLTEREVLNYMAQLVEGYRQLYANQIIHRDLKPANILIKNNQLKIADFGFSIDQKETLSGNKYNVGSPLYMPPESLKHNEYSYGSDVWALGIICYEMVHGKTPWSAKTEKELMRKIDSEDISKLVCRGIHPLLEEFILRSLQHERSNRLRPRDLGNFEFKVMNIKRELFFSESMQSIVPLGVRDQNIRSQRGESKPKKDPKGKLQPNNLIHLKSMEIENIIHNKSGVGDIPRDQRKHISNLLLSQIHFCRFLFKFIQRVKDHNPQIWQDIINPYSSLVMYKIGKLQHFQFQNFLGVRYYHQYKETGDYERIMKITREYSQKYSNQLYFDSIGGNWSIGETIETTKRYINYLYYHLVERLEEESIENLVQETIILDYLIIAYQLFTLIEDGENYEYFAKKSKIEEIVEGRSTLVTLEHFNRISEKFSDLML